ncbi:hypothetical protein N7492_001068 [Penicillium capsulatum]|uniref:Zn(2)-C6 fungal-type domain-containing protein n=1 Tax=Penicillium capsulatum TaxID=69766 RepID=A0A9W9ISZ0_9EURO|nr:hypothetical protein N7492_001068 [Penicillium capsulatum]KAJ6129874.1 hypothetical protein N7512_002654 [Penicillium capsulatum]
MQSNQAPSGTPAPYGRACLNCSRAKSKCIILEPGTGCERCQRLKKECNPSPTVRKRNGRSSASKAAQLEAKLDSIVSLLKTTGGTSGLPADWESTAKAHAAVRAQPVQNNYAAAPIPSPLSTPSPPSSTCSVMEVCLSLHIPPELAEKSLNQFRSANLKFFPCLYIPPHLTAQQLLPEKPFLWLCIVAVCLPGSMNRDGLFDKITELLYKEVLVNVTLSMDILLGLMTFLSWMCYSKRPFLNFYSNFLIGVVSDMGINKAPLTEHSTMQAFKHAMGWRQVQPMVRTIDERRAALGAFLMTSSVALCMFRIDSLRWNSHMEESLSILTDAKESPEDELLVALVKIQLVMERNYHLRRDGGTQSLSEFYIKSFQSQLESVKSQIPPSLKENKTVRMYLATAELTIHEVAMQTPSVPHSPELNRLESLRACLQATKTWLDIWLSFHPTEYVGVPFTIFYQFSRALVSLFKLSTLEDPAWDKGMVRNTANVLEFIDQCIYKMKNCADTANINAPNDIDWNTWEKGVRMCQSIKQGWEPRLMEAWYPNMPGNGLEGALPQTGPEIVDPFPIHGLDDDFMLEFFGSL